MRIILIYLVVLVFLSLNPWLHTEPGQTIGTIDLDKIDHAAAYCLLSLLVMWAFRRHRQRWVVSFLVLLACPLVGVLFEYCQLWFTSSRHFSYYDAVANVFGAVLGVFLFWCYSIVAVKRAS